MKTLTSGMVVRTCAMLLFATLFATSAKATSYVSDVILLGDTDKSAINSLVSQYEKKGWTKISRDLNDDAGGDYIYLLYKKQSTAGQNYGFITDFYAKNPHGSVKTWPCLIYMSKTCMTLLQHL